VGGDRFMEVSATDLVVALGGEVRSLEQAREVGGASHRSWVPDRQVVGPRGAAWGPFAPRGGRAHRWGEGGKSGGSAPGIVEGRAERPRREAPRDGDELAYGDWRRRRQRPSRSRKYRPSRPKDRVPTRQVTPPRKSAFKSVPGSARLRAGCAPDGPRSPGTRP